MPAVHRHSRLLAIPEQLLDSPTNYHVAPIVDLAATVIFLLIGLRAPLSPGARVAAFAAGLAGWSFLEYAMHRWVGHGPSSFARRGHTMHHSDDQALVAAPVFFVMIGAFVIWAALALLAGTGIAALLVCGLYVGYNLYTLVHHVLHHHEAFATPGWLQRIERRHRIHHTHHHVNFGVTSPLWDRVFRTYQSETFSKTSRS
jgi:dihydroceramide fatty acyl 2-hydroxylase